MMVFGMIIVISIKWVTKYIIIKRAPIPQKLGIELSEEMYNILEFFPLIYSISKLYFDYLVEHKQTKLTLLAIAIGLLICILPMNSISKLFYKIEMEGSKFSHSKYSDVELELTDTYNESNPAT